MTKQQEKDEARMAKIRAEEAFAEEHRQEEIDIWDIDRGWIRIKKPLFQEEKEKSVCCNASLIGGAQCENCGADGRKFETE